MSLQRGCWGLSLLCLALFAPSAVSAATLSWSGSSPGGGGAFASPASSVGGSLVIASDLSGVYRSTNGGASWTGLGPNSGILDTHVDAVAFHPTIDGTLFLGGDNGIYKSVNCGTSPVGDCTFTRTPLAALVTAIGTASTGTASATTLYAAGLNGWCQQGEHLWKSTNNGASWSAVAAAGLPANANIMAIRVQPAAPNTLIAISADSRFTNCGSSSGFPTVAPNRAFISTNSGATFSPLYIPSGVPALLETDGATTWAYIDDVKFDKANPHRIWATVTANPTNASSWNIDGELWMSTGASGLGTAFNWQSGSQTGMLWPLTTGNVRAIDLRRQHPWDTGRNGVWEWSATSSSWTRLTSDAEYSTWTRGWSAVAYGGSLNGDLHTVSPVNDTALLWVDSQFAYHTTNGGHLFQEMYAIASGTPASFLSTGINNAVPAVLKPSAPDAYLYAGYFDMGCWSTGNAAAAAPRWIDCNGPKTYPATSPWNGSWGGYGGNTLATAPDPQTAGTVWAVHAEGAGAGSTFHVAKSLDHGATWIDRTYNLNALTGSNPIVDLLVDAPTAGTRVLWALTNGSLYTLNDAGSAWSKVATPCDGGQQVFAKSGNRFLVGGDSPLCYSADGGATWAVSNLDGGFWFGPPAAPWDGSYGGVSDIAFDPANPSKAWLTVVDPSWTQQSGVAGLYVTTDGGATWTLNSNFAPQPFGRNFARTVAVSPANSNVVVVGTSTAWYAGSYRIPNSGDSGIGAWVSRDGGATWSLENAGLAWPFMNKLRFSGGATPRLWGISPGQGVVFSKTGP